MPIACTVTQYDAQTVERAVDKRRAGEDLAALRRGLERNIDPFHVLVVAWSRRSGGESQRGGDFRWPPAGTARWPLTAGARQHWPGPRSCVPVHPDANSRVQKRSGGLGDDGKSRRLLVTPAVGPFLAAMAALLAAARLVHLCHPTESAGLLP